MVDYEKQFEQPAYALGTRQTAISATFRRVYGWMSLALVLSGVVAWFTASSGLYAAVLQGPGLLGCVVAELALVFVLTLAINRMGAALATVLFIAYAALNGLTLSVVFVAYKLAVVEKAFFVTAGMFGGLVAWGSLTKGDLSTIGSACGMALWGVVIASVVNIFTHSSGLDWIITFVSILVFTGLAMYDAQKIRQLAAAEGSLDAAAVRKAGILGALTLYLDFINLFLSILRFFGRKD